MPRSAIFASAALLLLAATPAAAHPGHGGGFVAGFVHPFTGTDHMLAMIGVGLWAGLACNRAWLAWPVAFVTFMLAGFTAGIVGGPLPMAETVIALSVIGLGLAVTFNVRAPLVVGVVAVALAGLAHGYAHGQEATDGAFGFPLGFTLATLALHAMGLAMSWAIQRANARPLARVAGIGVTAAGLAIALAG